jgi:hypothetical protein
MNKYPLNTIIPSIDNDGDIVMPISWKMGEDQDKTIVLCFKHSMEDAKEFHARLGKLLK